MRLEDVLDATFSSILGEAYAGDYVSHASALRVTDRYREKYRPLVTLLQTDALSQELFSTIYDDIGEPRGESRDYRHLQLSVHQFLRALDAPECQGLVLDVTNCIDRIAEYSDLSYDSALGLAAMLSYEERFPLKPADAWPSPLAQTAIESSV